MQAVVRFFECPCGYLPCCLEPASSEDGSLWSVRAAVWILRFCPRVLPIIPCFVAHWHFKDEVRRLCYFQSACSFPAYRVFLAFFFPGSRLDHFIRQRALVKRSSTSRPSITRIRQEERVAGNYRCSPGAWYVVCCGRAALSRQAHFR